MQYVYPLLFTLLVWWFSTGVILYLDGLPRKTFRWTFAAATGLLAAALFGVAETRGEATVFGAYLAFACSIVAWGWQETGFLMGFITGPRRLPCPPGCTGAQRFVYAFQAILYHELAIVVLGVVIAALAWDGVNQVARDTYCVLWIMRVSAKLNVFLGVRNLYENFLPESLRYLQTYFRRKPMNPLFPASIALSTSVAAILWMGTLADDATAFDVVAGTLVATILTLAVLEHWFLVVPLPADALWRWGLRSRERRNPSLARPAKNKGSGMPFIVSEIGSLPPPQQ